MPKFYNFTYTISNFLSITLASYHNNPVIRSLSFMKRSLLPEEKSRALSISPSFKYYILNNDAFNNIFQSIFHPAFETSYSDFILRSDYKQIISDKEKTNCAIKQEFLDNSIDLRLSHCFLHRRLQKEEQGYTGAATYSPEVSFRYRLTSEATVWAIFQSLILIQDIGYSKAVIFSDSKSVLLAPRLINFNYIIHWIKRLLASLIAEASLLSRSRLIVIFWATK